MDIVGGGGAATEGLEGDGVGAGLASFAAAVAAVANCACSLSPILAMSTAISMR